MNELERVNAVQNMQDYIKLNLYEPITLLDLSHHAGYSPFHCTRLFKEITGKSPFEYIRALRLTQAALKLRDEKVKVLDVALDYLFDSHEGFTRAFSKEFGITPNLYRKKTPPIKLFMPASVRDAYLFYQRGELKMDKKPPSSTIFVQVIDRPQRKLILKRGIKGKNYFEYSEEVGCDVWGLLCSVKEALYEPIGMWLPPRFQKAGTSSYVQGVEVPADYSGEVPEGMDIIDLPPCQMMVFQGQPFDDDLFYQAVIEVEEIINNYNPEIYGFVWADDDAPRFQLEPQGYRGYIEARPVKRISQ